jgi:hypothetical protein
MVSRKGRRGRKETTTSKPHRSCNKRPTPPNAGLSDSLPLGYQGTSSKPVTLELRRRAAVRCNEFVRLQGIVTQ